MINNHDYHQIRSYSDGKTSRNKNSYKRLQVTHIIARLETCEDNKYRVILLIEETNLVCPDNTGGHKQFFVTGYRLSLWRHYRHGVFENFLVDFALTFEFNLNLYLSMRTLLQNESWVGF